MAINSYGYPGTIAPGSTLSKYMTNGVGHRYAVAGFTDFRVSVGSGTRRVNIGAGLAFGKGVLVENTATMTYDLPAPSGSTQWMLVGLRRWNGSSPYTSIVTHVLGNANRAVPTVTQDPGTNDTQWLALCRVTSAATAVQEVVDLRLISTEGSGFYVCLSDLAMDQLSDAVGAEVYRADTTSGHVPAFYRRVVGATGALSWKNPNLPDTILTGAAATESFFPGWGRDASCLMVRDGHQRFANIMVNKSGAARVSDGTGRILDIDELVKFHPEDRPRSGTAIALAGHVETETGGRFVGTGRLGSDGTLRFTSTWSGRAISAITLSGTYSVA